MPEKLLGRVLDPKRSRTSGEYVYGFIHTDDKTVYFFHVDYVADGVMPVEGTLVRFVPVPQTAKDKNPRAVAIEIVSEPNSIFSPPQQDEITLR